MKTRNKMVANLRKLTPERATSVFRIKLLFTIAAAIIISGKTDVPGRTEVKGKANPQAKNEVTSGIPVGTGDNQEQFPEKKKEVCDA